MSARLAQSPYVVVVARVGFEPMTLRTQGTELTTKPPCPQIYHVNQASADGKNKSRPIVDEGETRWSKKQMGSHQGMLRRTNRNRLKGRCREPEGHDPASTRPPHDLNTDSIRRRLLQTGQH